LSVDTPLNVIAYIYEYMPKANTCQYPSMGIFGFLGDGGKMSAAVAPPSAGFHQKFPKGFPPMRENVAEPAKKGAWK
jgi:hypothetical protein